MGAMTWALGWFGWGRKDEGLAPSLRAVQDKSRFHYSPELIGALKGDHGQLLQQYGEIERMAVHGQHAGLPLALAAFKAKFDVHVLNENLHFYCYLEHTLGRNPADLQLIQDFRTEMNTIARGVVNFVKKYRVAGVRQANARDFLTELRAVGALLAQRIQREEHDLHTLYRP